MPLFAGQDVADYPAYVVVMQFSDPEVASPQSFLIVNYTGAGAPAGGTYASEGPGAFNGSAEAGLIGAIASYVETNGWNGAALVDLTITKFTQASSDVTP